MFNAQSIRNKMDSFRALMIMEEPDVVGITESWISTDSTDFEGEYAIPGYKIFKRDRKIKKGGGVLLYVREYLDPVGCDLTTEHEILGVVLKKTQKRTLYIFSI